MIRRARILSRSDRHQPQEAEAYATDDGAYRTDPRGTRRRRARAGVSVVLLVAVVLLAAAATQWANQLGALLAGAAIRPDGADTPMILANATLANGWGSRNEGPGTVDASGAERRSRVEAQSVPEKFLVLSTQRSGSRFLTGLLNNHSRVVCGNEEMLHVNLTELSLEEYVRMVEQKWDSLLKKSPPDSPRPDAVGFKIMYSQGFLRWGAALLAELDRRNVKIIHLIRTNRLLHYVSRDTNDKDGRTHTKKNHVPHPKTEEAAAKLRKVRAKGKRPKKVLWNMRKLAKETAKVSAFFAKANFTADWHAEVEYERLSEDTDTEVARLIAFLGLEPAEKLATPLVKIHIEKRARKYFASKEREALVRELNSSEFAWVLDEW